MARSVYFSFHYQDVADFRANVVRNSGKFRSKGDQFRDSSIWEEAEEKKVKAIKALIDQELFGVSVTCVLIGNETYLRRWVRYELVKSFEMNKGQVAVGINWIKGKDGNIKFWPGENPFDYLGFKVSKDGSTVELFEKRNDKWTPYKDLPQIINNRFSSCQFGKEYRFSHFYNRYSYDWHSGKTNFTTWIEEAANRAGR